MSLVVLENGQRFEIESPTGTRDGVLRQRERNILPLTFRADDERFADIKAAFANSANTETITLYYPEIPETATAAMLAPEGIEPPAHEVYEGYTIPGEIKEEDKILTPGTPTAPPAYGRQLSIELGQRQFGE